MRGCAVLLAMIISLFDASVADSADYKEVRPLLSSNQTWDFGKGNGNQFAVYKWSLRSIQNPALKLNCISPGHCVYFEGALRAPDGYKICKATLWFRSTGIPIPSTFNGTLNDQTRQLLWYADFGTKEPQPLSSIVSFDLVPDSDFSTPCMHDCYLWQCGAGAGNRQGCNEFQPGGVLR
jgi:hypothetical protein